MLRSSQLNKQKLILKVNKGLENPFFKEDPEIAKKHIKRCSPSLNAGKNASQNHNVTPTRVGATKTTNTA